jgi:hypothetical protein
MVELRRLCAAVFVRQSNRCGPVTSLEKARGNMRKPLQAGPNCSQCPAVDFELIGRLLAASIRRVYGLAEFRNAGRAARSEAGFA